MSADCYGSSCTPKSAQYTTTTAIDTHGVPEGFVSGSPDSGDICIRFAISAICTDAEFRSMQMRQKPESLIMDAEINSYEFVSQSGAQRQICDPPRVGIAARECRVVAQERTKKSGVRRCAISNKS